MLIPQHDRTQCHGHLSLSGCRFFQAVDSLSISALYLSIQSCWSRLESAWALLQLAFGNCLVVLQLFKLLLQLDDGGLLLTSFSSRNSASGSDGIVIGVSFLNQGDKVKHRVTKVLSSLNGSADPFRIPGNRSHSSQTLS
jgi:hypothetical protein